MKIDSERYFVSEPAQRSIAREIYQSAADLPLVCPHTHVDPRLFSEPDTHFENPVELLVKSDHYVLRLLHSRGIAYHKLGIATKGETQPELDPRKIWQIFADHFYAYAATPTGNWIRDELADVFGITELLNHQNAQEIYSSIQAHLDSPLFTPRRLYESFNISVLCTTDSVSSPLAQHEQIAASGWQGHILPTFRADSIVHIDQPGWCAEIDLLAAASGVQIHSYASFLQAVESRRVWFKQHGATAADLSLLSAKTADISTQEMESLFQKGRNNQISSSEASQFEAGMVMELARMSCEDGLLLQLHVGIQRNHDLNMLEQCGADMGADFPVAVEFTHNMQPLLSRFGNYANFHLIIFTLDEAALARELAPLASYYPALKLGPPWWFNDNLNGMQRFFDQAIDSAGIYNTVGFNDDTRGLLSIPARHDLWRRASANWLSGLVLRQIVSNESARQMIKALSCGLALKAYALEEYAPKEARLD